MVNPFLSSYSKTTDAELVSAALDGNKAALEQLVVRHQQFIYNVAWRMVLNPQDAEDVTQEVLIKIITRLGQFKGKSEFRTWLYRIVVNHILNMKKRPLETVVTDFEEYGDTLDNMPDEVLTEEEALTLRETIEEVKISCMAGMLLCLDRPQRLVYILGELFEIDHKIGSEILEISPDNFRQRLSRARKDLYNFMQNKCGLVNKENPCRCRKKTKGFIAAGFVDPNNLRFNINYIKRIYQVVPEKMDQYCETVDDYYAQLYGEHPYQIPPSAGKLVEEILNDGKIKMLFNLN